MTYKEVLTEETISRAIPTQKHTHFLTGGSVGTLQWSVPLERFSFRFRFNTFFLSVGKNPLGRGNYHAMLLVRITGWRFPNWVSALLGCIWYVTNHFPLPEKKNLKGEGTLSNGMRHSNRLLWHQSPEIIVSNILWIKPVWTANKFWSSRRVYIRISISCLKAAFLLVSTMNRDHLWKGPTPEVPDSRTLPSLCPCSCWDYKTSSPRMIQKLNLP